MEWRARGTGSLWTEEEVEEEEEEEVVEEEEEVLLEVLAGQLCS